MLNRILNLDWTVEKPNKGKSLKLLMVEYMRRITLWSDSLKIEWIPFIDVAYHIDKDKRSNVFVLNTKAFPNHIVKKTCEFMLHWDLVKESDEVKNLNLPDPFEPLIKFYERGGSIYYEAAKLVIESTHGTEGVCNMNRSFYVGQPTFIEINDEILDRIDDDLNESIKND